MAAKLSTKLSDACLDVLRRSKITDTAVTLPEQLDRKLYVEVNKALTAAGGKWNKSSGTHIFPKDPRTALGLTVETGEAVNHQQVKQAFYTPAELATRVAMAANLRNYIDGELLEPSCGHGALILAALEQQPELAIVAYDSDPDAFATIVKDKRLNNVVASCRDFLLVEPPRRGTSKYKRVVMNPPFRGGADIEHVTHAFKFLAPDGLLVAIMSPAWRYNEQKKAVAFRKLLEQHQHSIEEIEAGAFSESGTKIATVLVKIWNKPPL